MPVDGSVVPLSKSFLPLGMMADGMIDGGGGIARQHAKKVEDDAYTSPVIIALKTPYEEDDANDNAQQDAATMG